MNIGTDYSSLEAVAKEYNATVLYDEPMKNHTSFKIGGACDMMIKINCEELLCRLLAICRENNIRHYVIGKGSNILVSDKGLFGVVLLLGAEFSTITVEGEYITAKAGASLGAVCTAALKNSLTGFEFAYGIPGSMGGALYMNAGAYGGEMKDVVCEASYIDENYKIKTIPLEKMELSYRHSVFCGTDSCITSVKLKLRKGDSKAIKSRMDELMQRRLDKQPIEYPSAGSTFKRPEGDFAARLIEVCGLKGLSVGDAEVSQKHSGFVINKGNATAEDVKRLIEMIKERVKAQTGITLECEMLILE